MELNGYLIVLKQDLKLNIWKNNRYKDKPSPYIDLLRNTFKNINPYNYKGIDRFPLEGYSAEEILKYSPADIDNTKDARLKMFEFVKHKHEAELLYSDFNDDIDSFSSIDDALDVYNLLLNKIDYEIIEVRRGKYDLNDLFLGFDIGYWGGDHFSIISDTVIAPQWHPADPKDFNELSKYFDKLNSCLLFDNEEDAIEFRKYYKGKDWAETDMPNNDEETEFYLIQINKVFI
jgi:hypothetical protein